MGFLRFVDLRIATIRLRLECFDTSTEFRCRALSVGITAVLVAENLLFVELHASSVYARSARSRFGAFDTTDGVIRDGVLLDCPSLCVVADLQLDSRTLVGVKLHGVKNEPIGVQLSTAYVEFALRKRLELISRGLFPVPVRASGTAASVKAAERAVLLKEITNVSVSVIVVHDLDDRTTVPLKVEADVLSASTTRVEMRSSSTTTALNNDFGDETDLAPALTGTSHQGVAWNVSLATGRAFKQRILSISTLETSMRETSATVGAIECSVGEMEAFVNPRVSAILQSLAAWSDRLRAIASESELALVSARDDRHAPGAFKSPAPIARPAKQIAWDVTAKLRLWRATAVIQAKHELAEELTVEGEATTITASIASPASSRQVKRTYDVQVDTIRTDVVTPFAVDKQRHTAVFVGAAITFSKDPTHEHASAMSLDATFQSVSVNSNTRANERSDIAPFPVANMQDVHIKRFDKRSADSADTELTVSIADARVQWNHRTHAAFLREWAAIVALFDKVDRMLALRPPAIETATDIALAPAPLATKAFALDVRATSTEVRLFDVRDVARLVTVRLGDTRATHHKQPLTTQSALECSAVHLLWESACPAVDIVDVKFQHKVLLGPQRLLAKVPVQSTIRASQMRVFMRPERRLLLLLLRFDELVNVRDDGDASCQMQQTSSERKPTRQGVTFDCTQLTLALFDTSAPDDADSASDGAHGQLCHVSMDALEIKSVVSKAFEMSESMRRFLHSTDENDASAFVASVQQVLSVEGSVCANSLALLRAGKSLAVFRQLEVQFALTNVTRSVAPSTSAEVPDKTTIFDVSALARGCDVRVESGVRQVLARVLPAVQDTFDTRENVASTSSSHSDTADWRLRYIGNLDFGLQQCVMVAPYGDSSSSVVDASSIGLGERNVRVSLRDFALNFRQFQKLVLQLSTLQVHLEAPSDAKMMIVSDADAPLQLICVPHLALDAMVHWRDRPTSSEHASPTEFAVSLELSLKSKSGSACTMQAPVHDEALVALNWDYVYPLLVYFLTDDEDDGVATASEHSDGDSGRLRCLGVQWDVSVDIAQVAFWDAMTKDVGLLLVVNDVLSHGLAKHESTAPQCQNPLASEGAWAIHEATTYMDLCRAYVLRHCVRSDDDFVATVIAETEALPFRSTKASNFFFEAIGTSYRAIRPSAASSGDSVDDTHDGDPDALFPESVGTFSERLHDQFMPIDFQFSLFGSTKLRRVNSIVSASLSSSSLSSSMPSPSALGTTSPAPPTSPTQKSARPWTRSVRAKLLRLKRRSSSMDNLLLNDGSCPIQVDSMKLLWTIETRDTVFYMTSLVFDSMQRLADAKKSQLERQSASSDSRCSGATSGAESSAPKIHTWRPATAVSHDTIDPLRSSSPSSASSQPRRRGSTRDTLLDLLQQGKLGMKQVSSSPDPDSATQRSSDGSNEPRMSSGVGEEMHAAKSIAVKQYTLDVHDAQINIREENSQSSVLAASKHIHLDVGLDQHRSHTVAHLTFTSVTGHVAPIDVDISAGVLWYAQSPLSPAQSPRSASSTPSSSSSLLKQVMDECSLSMTYSQALATGATAVAVDLSFLQLSTDRHQFYQLLNVMRHVLLAPPTIVRKQRRPHAAPPSTPSSHTRPNNVSDLIDQEVSDVMVFPASPSVSVGALSSKKTHAQLLDELRSREAKQLNARTSVISLKCISFRVEGTRFRLRSSPEITGADHEFVEIRAEGIAGSHTFFSNQCTKLSLNLQWMEVTNLRPGPSSIAFDDAMAVLKAKLLVDKRYQSSSRVHFAHQRGMLSIRAESGPLIRVLGQKLRVLDVLEVSVFPEIANMIVIQLAADFYDLVYKFFFEPIGAPDHHDLNSEQVLFGRRAGQLSPGVRGGRAPNATPLAVPATPPRRKSAQLSSSANPGLALDMSALYASASTSAASALATAPTVSSPLESTATEDDDASTDGCELFYFKYVRIGNVRLRINCNGFFVNLSDFDLDLPPYVCQSKLCTWKKLLQKFESHLKWFVTKESASSGLSHFKNKFLKWTPSGSSTGATTASFSLLSVVTSDRREKARKDEDTSVINAQVLFGPYSGAAT